MKQIKGPCLCGDDDCPRCYPHRVHVVEDPEELEALAEAYFERRFEDRLERAREMNRELGGGA